MTHSKSKIQSICMIGLMTAVLAVMAQISIPLPVGVPMTLQSLAVMLAGILLGHKKGTYATLIYILVGLIGIPVFSNFTGGYQCLVGPTGGFLLSFPLMAWLSGLGMKYRTHFRGALSLFLTLGNVVNLLCGTAMFCIVSGSTLIVGITSCILPFLPITIIKIVLAIIIGIQIRKRL